MQNRVQPMTAPEPAGRGRPGEVFMRTTWSVLGLLALAGCSGGDPDTTPGGGGGSGVDPGYKPIHRLNTTEYRNTVRDLLYTDYELKVELPPDPIEHGFDNVAELLTVSPLLVEQYEAATNEVLEDVFDDA